MNPQNPLIQKPKAHIFQINTSAGGVPKSGRKASKVTALGLIDDHQNNLQVHGGPERALCLYSLERILDLQAEGHPIFPGALGENLTLVGVDWEKLQPGDRLQLGEEVQVEITRYTTPCNTLTDYFKGGNFSRILQEKYPGWSRVYVRVLKEGEVKVGDEVEMIVVD